MKALFLVTAILIAGCSPNTTVQTNETVIQFGGCATFVRLQIIEKDGHKFAVASSSIGISIVEIK